MQKPFNRRAFYFQAVIDGNGGANKTPTCRGFIVTWHLNSIVLHQGNACLHELRGFIPKLDNTKEYIVYCQTGRRSSAAAFILAQFGLQAVVLEGGTRGT